MIRVLFVCLGNICRSPMAEAVFTRMVNEAGLADKIEVDSAGTGDWHVGQPAHHGTRDVLARNGIDYLGCGRQIKAQDLEEFDYVVVMDNVNYSDVRQLHANGRAKIARLLDYALHTGVSEVPDPYFHGGFDGVYDLVHAGSAGLLAAIREEHEL